MNTANEGITDTLVALKSRLPEITDRDRIENVISNTRKAINDHLEPTLGDLEHFFSETNPQSKFGKDFMDKVCIAANIRHTAEWLRGVTHSIQIVNEHLNIISKEVGKNFAKRLVTDAASFRELNVLGYVDVLSKYVDRLMKTLYVLVMEEASHSGTRPYRPSRGSQAYTAECVSFVTITMSSIYSNAKDLDRAIRELADVGVTEETVGTLSASRPSGAINLLPSGFLASKWNVFFSAYKWYVEYQVNTYNRRKEERQALALVLQQVKEDRDAMPNGDKAKVQRWIQTLEDRIERLDAKIANFEKEYDLED